MPRAVILCLLILAPVARAAGPAPTPEQERTLEAYRQVLWDEGYSDAEIEEELDLKRREILGRPSGEDVQRELDRLLADIAELGDRKLYNRKETQERQEYIRRVVDRMPPAEKLEALFNLRRTVREQTVQRWREALMRESSLPPMLAARKADEKLALALKLMLDKIQILRTKGLSGEAMAAEIRKAMPNLPGIFIDPDMSAPVPPPPALEEDFPLSDEEMDEVIDDLMEDILEGP